MTKHPSSEINLGKEFLKLIDSYSLDEQMRTLNSVFGKDLDGGCEDYHVPNKYSYGYGINKASLLSAVLEKYHQLRLKDKE